ncbi:DUF3515 domain-containing protein [Actinacidiphila acididurans]|uniref:DUF3515 domain-containing protein n=1 Tax=Actinacidiphila acididurans TaxID=2784346 RepID=A0ABS2TM72_9ACTN|nr:DUF3515 domain-containing protein [Actinacidiphila acididurans]MBM9503887.1 DUF3515 domain-containing protein [Actinacidiphila acididurans]
MMYRRIVLIAVSAVAVGSAAAVYAFTADPSGADGALSVPIPDPQVASYCRALHAALPSRVDGLPRHDLKPVSDLTAGWGSPAIVLRCGVQEPVVDRNPDADAVSVDGVGWVIEQQPGGKFRLTTTLRKAYVEVTLPKKWAGDLDPLTDLAGAVKRTVPEGI